LQVNFSQLQLSKGLYLQKDSSQYLSAEEQYFQPIKLQYFVAKEIMQQLYNLIALILVVEIVIFYGLVTLCFGHYDLQKEKNFLHKYLSIQVIIL
jgi:hypothetical protein